MNLHCNWSSAHHKDSIASAARSACGKMISLFSNTQAESHTSLLQHSTQWHPTQMMSIWLLYGWSSLCYHIPSNCVGIVSYRNMGRYKYGYQIWHLQHKCLIGTRVSAWHPGQVGNTCNCRHWNLLAGEPWILVTGVQTSTTPKSMFSKYMTLCQINYDEEIPTTNNMYTAAVDGIQPVVISGASKSLGKQMFW